MIGTAVNWPARSVCLRLASSDTASIAEDAYQLACRTDLDMPGFCIISIESVADSVSFRRLMVDLKGAMSEIHASKTGGSLVYLSASRFDQRSTTRPHLDGGPDECLLMLGYEPSNVKSEIEISDYSKCAYHLGITPKAFMTEHNPMFDQGSALLKPYSMRVPCFSPLRYQIVCINNSSAPYSTDGTTWQGVLHNATIEAVAETDPRIVNSTMIGTAPRGDHDLVSLGEQLRFINMSQHL